MKIYCNARSATSIYTKIPKNAGLLSLGILRLNSLLLCLFQRNRPARCAAQATPDCDVLGVRGPGELSAVTTTAFILQGSNQCIG